MKRVGVDLDEVVADFITSFNTLSNDAFGRPKDITYQWPEWSITSSLGLTETQEAHLWDQIVCSATFWESMPALPGAGAALQRVSRLESRQELDVWFVTSRPDVGTTLSQTERWLRQFGFASPRVIITDDKGEVAKVVRFDYFIDDRDKNCLDIKKASPGTTVMMPEKAYNRALWFSRDLVLVSDFTEAVRLIEEGL